jgi:membrane protease YdiL (CAAX protease family)
MSILVFALPLLLLIALANWVTARGSAGARTAFHLGLFLLHLLLLIAGVALRLSPPDVAALHALGELPFDPAFAGAPFIGIGLWGMVVALRPARLWLARLLPALDVEAAVHTLALAAIGYLAGNVALTLSPGIDVMAESSVEVALIDVVAQAFVFVLAAALGVGLFVRRDGRGAAERLGLQRPTGRQLAGGAGWMVFFVFLQGCIGALWLLLSPEEAMQIGGLNNTLLGNFDTAGEWLVLAAATGLSEELLFRGALQPIFGILPTSLIFAISHVQYGLSPATLTVFLLSVVLGIIRKRSNTTVAILVHGGYNLALGLLRLLALSLIQ